MTKKTTGVKHRSTGKTPDLTKKPSMKKRSALDLTGPRVRDASGAETAFSAPVDLMIVFDVTPSMYTALAAVRDSIVGLLKELSGVLPDLRVGILAHGDYGDSPVFEQIGLTGDLNTVATFVRTVKGKDAGYDFPECYELMLRKLRSVDWRNGAAKRVIMIGDALPHQGMRSQGIHWHDEATALKSAGVQLHAVKVLQRSTQAFWLGLSQVFGTTLLQIDQLTSVVDSIGLLGFSFVKVAEAYKPRNDNPDYRRSLAMLLGKQVSARSASIGSEYQVLDVHQDIPIAEFVRSYGVQYVVGQGYYEHTKTETIQDYKEVIAVNRDTGSIVTGARARRVLGIGTATGRYPAKNRGSSIGTHIGFIQSTSVNRKLIGGTRFLYKESVEKMATV